MKRGILAFILINCMVFGNVSPVSAAGENDTRLSGSVLQQAVSQIDIEPTAGSSGTEDSSFGYIDSGLRVPKGIDAAEELNSSDSGLLNSASSYDLRSQGLITGVRNQSPYGDCWSFSALASGESSLIKKNLAGTSVDLSELHLSYFSWNRTNATQPAGCEGDTTTWSTNYLNYGGNDYLAITSLARWCGAANESSVPYGLGSSYSANDGGSSYGQNSYILTNARMANVGDRNAVKNLIETYGAVSAYYYMDPSYYSSAYYNPSKAAYYYNGSEQPNHAITLAGWDDNYPASNFNGACRPSSDGAWLVKNSWGTSFGLSGYFWISYQDSQLSNAAACSFELSSAGTYAHNYQYDGATGMSALYGNNAYYMSNVFTAGGSQKLRAVSFFSYNINLNYTVSIYKNVSGKPDSGTLAASQSGSFAEAGYHTVDMNDDVTFSAGEKFSVVIALRAGGSVYAVYEGSGTNVIYYKDSQGISHVAYTETAHADAGESFFSWNGSDWYDMKADYNTDGNFRIKAFTDDYTAAAEPNHTPSLSSVSVRRLSGGDRFETAAKIAEAAFPDGASEAVLVSGQAFPDALSATAYAGAKGCPVLITMPGYLSNATKSLISELRIRSVTVIGGKSAVSDNVLSTLSQMGVSYVRIFGNDRFETAEKVYESGLEMGLYSSSACFVACGANPADVLSASPWSYYYKYPVFLADASGNLSGTSLSYARKFSKIYVVGGTSVVSTGTEALLGGNAERLAGNDRYETSVKIAEKFASSGGTLYSAYGNRCRLSSYFNNTAFASGRTEQFADPLVGGMLQARQKIALSGYTDSDGNEYDSSDTVMAPAPILLINDSSNATYNYVRNCYTGQSGLGSVTNLIVLGGDSVINPTLQTSITGLFQ